MMYPLERIHQIVNAQVRHDAEMIERACEQSLQGSEHGVLVLRSVPSGRVISAEVDESVPYGMIHHRPKPP